MNSLQPISPFFANDMAPLSPVRKTMQALQKTLTTQTELWRFYGDIAVALSGSTTKALLQTLKSPERMVSFQLEWLDGQLDLLRDAGFAALQRHRAPDQGPKKNATVDQRFAHSSWHDIDFFRWLHQSYLISSNTLSSATHAIDLQDTREQKQVEYLARQIVSAFSPANFVLTNPQLLAETFTSGGNNLVRGTQKFMRHFDVDWDGIDLQMSDTRGFRLGETLAATPGGVVFQNELFQLLQYEATTTSVLKRPLLVVPPPVNKYYIMDLSPENSMLKWFVDQGHTVFVISWINPDETYRHTRFENYLLRGIEQALSVACDICATDKVNAVGYCMGGTMLGMLVSRLLQCGDQRIASATFFNALFDYGNPGELAAFLTEPLLRALERHVRHQGVHDGRIMALSFNTLAENALFWPFFVDNYMRGNEPPQFDLLYWNTDNTNIPAEMYLFFLREIYQHNKLTQPGAITIDGTPIDMRAISIPTYFVAAEKDHITPWRATYLNTQIVSAPSRFVLSGSGHIAGIINPPNANKYGYKTFDATPTDADDWLENASSHAGSWWPDWQRWCEALDAQTVTARCVGNAHYPYVEPAPGSFVKKRLVPAH